jgi:hypothetical protein
MSRLVIYSIIVVVGSILLFFIKKDNSATDFLINILATVLIICLELIIENLRFIKLYIQTHTKYRNKKIRISISYLYQIEVLGKYLLVKGHRIPNQFQPVGGVYKRSPESFYELRNLRVTDDNNIPIDDKSERDLRIKLPGCNVIKFLKWFNSQLGREVSPFREFYEELIATDILNGKRFPYPNYIYLKRHQTPIHWSEHFKCYEILIADIFKLMPDEGQLHELKKLFDVPSTEYVWVNSDTIENKGANESYNVSETATWTL